MAKPQAAPAPSPRKRPAPADMNENLMKVVDAFSRDFHKRDGSVFTIATEDAIKQFNQLVASGDADAMALYLENPTQLLLALVFVLNSKIQSLESRVAALE